jgi:hypothetical protein
MKNLMAALASLLIAVAPSAYGQFAMSHLSDARALDADGIVAGGGISVFEDALGFGGNIRIGVMDGLELQGKGGIINIDAEGGDDHTGITIGVDMKYQFLDVNYGDPIDLAFGGGIEYYNLQEDYSLWMFGSNTLVSYPVKFEGGQILSPFFRLNLRFDRIGNGHDDTDFEFGFGFGACLDITRHFGFFAEVVITGSDYVDDGFVGGVWFGL